jgi:hypothetical protein
MSEPAIGENCWKCKHVRADYTCAAFPKGVPAAISQGNPHTSPIKGDNGIQYEPRPEGDPGPVFISIELEERDEL